MRRALVIFAIIILIFCNVILSVNSYSLVDIQCIESENQKGLPDLISSIELFQIDNETWFNYSISNIGDAPADHYNISVWVYPYGTFLLRNNIMWFLHDIQFPISKIVYFLEEILHIKPIFIRGEGSDFSKPLGPGESVKSTSFGPFDEMIKDYYNTRICVILESTADPDNEILESNELNNRDVIKWWFPLRNDIPDT